ncbi:MAG: GNAT family N-acetyltransferase [Elusimicrobiota bacterium]|jgi:hypothetical protein
MANLPAGDFLVVLLFYLRDPRTRGLIESRVQKLCEPAHPFDLPQESLRFFPSFVDSQEELGSRLIDIIFQKGMNLILVSDALVEFKGEGKFTTSNLADVVVEGFYTNNRLCSLISVGSEDLPDIPGITLSLNLRTAPPEALRGLILKAGARLHLLSAPSKAQLDSLGETNVRIQVVQSPESLREVFRLRHRIYGVTGYLDSETEKNPLGLEMDYHDASALHLVATDEATGAVAGTIRMIFAHKPWGVLDSVFGPLSEIFQAQRGWFSEIVEEFGGSPMRERLLKPSCAPLPILQNLRVKNIAEWNRILDGVEVSRLIVAPQYRGLAMANLLMRLAIAAAYDAGKDLVLGEALPTHLGMYRKMGFKTIETEEGRAQASGHYNYTAQKIIIDLKEGMKERVTHIARGDLAFIRMANKHLMRTEGVSFTVRLGQYVMKPGQDSSGTASQ